jgi:hypothetical protein
MYHAQLQTEFNEPSRSQKSLKINSFILKEK